MSATTDRRRSAPAEVEITVLVDNTAKTPDLKAEHGLSCWVRTRGGSLLFDLGQSDAFLYNARQLNLDPTDLDAVVLSHGHYDHSGGLACFPATGSAAPLYLHPDAMRACYRKRATPPHKAIGMPPAARAGMAELRGTPVYTGHPVQIFPNLWATGPIPRRTAFEDMGGPFYEDAACTVPNAIIDDQAIWMETPDGIVVLLGCAHAGVINTLDHVAALADADSIHAVIGGLHLQDADEAQLSATLAGLRRHRVRMLAPCHCTGERAHSFLRTHLPDILAPCGSGARFVFRKSA